MEGNLSTENIELELEAIDYMLFLLANLEPLQRERVVNFISAWVKQYPESTVSETKRIMELLQ